MLEVKNVSVSYGRHRALEGASLKVDKGEICVILGANGAGKSTLLKTIAGMVHAESGGAVVMNGKDITTLKAHRIVEEGIALVPEGRGIFGDLTVAENLQLGAFAARARAHETATLAEIYRLFPRLSERKSQVARTMSGGEQQMVAIGRALMSKPDILMLDEPSLGLSPLLSQELFRALAEVSKTGVGILLVEQNAKQSLKIAGRGYLIENGQVTGENTASALMNDPAVVSAYLGGAVAPAPAEPTKPRITLPASIRLPAGIEALGRALVGFAARAGRIQSAFIRALRRDAPPPSAFVGRYDPKAIPDPWIEAAAAEPVRSSVHARTPEVASDARRLGESAADLGRRATERLAAHIATSRLSSARPSAFSSAGPRKEAAAPKPDVLKPEQSLVDKGNGSEVRTLIGHNSAGLDIDDDDRVSTAERASSGGSQKQSSGLTIADLAARAAEIHAAHVARSRKAIGPFAVVPEWRPSQPKSPETKPADTALSSQTESRLEVERPVSDAIADLVARAASIHSAHVARNRKNLTAYTIPVQPKLNGGSHDTGSAGGDTHTKHREA